MTKWLAAGLVLSLLVPGVVEATTPVLAAQQVLGQAEAAEEAAPEQSLARRVALFLPNRVFDVLDIVRLRVRVGPGIAAGARATRPVSVFVGAYTSWFVGLRGPRGEPRLP